MFVCFCCKCCKPSFFTVFISILSFIFFVTSIISLILIIRLNSSDLYQLMDMTAKWAMFFSFLGLSLGGIVISFIGCLAARLKNCFILTMFGISSLLLAISFFAGGGVLMGANYAGGKIIDQKCSNENGGYLVSKFSGYFDPPMNTIA